MDSVGIVPPALESCIRRLTISGPASDAARVLANRIRTRTDRAALLATQLAAIAMTPPARAEFELQMTSGFRNTASLNMQQALDQGYADELVIGAGFHAAVYCAVRVLNGYPKPFVIDPGQPGGSFRVSKNPSFWLNSENTAGRPGRPWQDGSANMLNWLPGAPVQTSQLSGREIPDNADMAFVIRVTLAMYSRYLRGTVKRIRAAETGNTSMVTLPVDIDGGSVINARRVIDARGLGVTRVKGTGSSRVLTWEQAMASADTDSPFYGMNRVAVIGGGKSALCAAETLLGIAPPHQLRAVADGVPRVDLYARDLPASRDGWLADVPRRYARLGSHLPSGRNPLHHDLTVRNINAPDPVTVPGGVMLGDEFYDMVITCAGRTGIPSLDTRSYRYYTVDNTDGDAPEAGLIARKAENVQSFRVGPVAALDWSDQERAAGVPASYPDNKVAMFRLAPRTAALAASLGPLL